MGMITTMTAIRVYNIDTMAYPSLDSYMDELQLAPHYVSKPMLDPYCKTAEPFRIKITEKGEALQIYTVGPNGIDDDLAEQSDDWGYEIELTCGWYLKEYLSNEENMARYELLTERSEALLKNIILNYKETGTLPGSLSQLKLTSSETADPFNEKEEIKLRYDLVRGYMEFWSVGVDGEFQDFTEPKVTSLHGEKKDGDIYTSKYILREIIENGQQNWGIGFHQVGKRGEGSE